MAGKQLSAEDRLDAYQKNQNLQQVQQTTKLVQEMQNLGNLKVDVKIPAGTTNLPAKEAARAREQFWTNLPKTYLEVRETQKKENEENKRNGKEYYPDMNHVGLKQAAMEAAMDIEAKKIESDVNKYDFKVSPKIVDIETRGFLSGTKYKASDKISELP